MDSGKIDSFCQKIEAMAKEVSLKEIGLLNDAMTASMPILLAIYRRAMELYSKDEACAAILDRIIEAAQTGETQDAFSSTTEDDILALGIFAEQYVERDEFQEAAQLFQFLTLLCPGGAPNPYPYLRLAESLSALDLDSGLQMYDFITKVFPDNPALLVSAAKHYAWLLHTQKKFANTMLKIQN